MRTASKRKGGFFIGVTCPGCGAELELQSDFFVLECTHCGSVLRVVMPRTPPAYVVSGSKEPREIRFHLDRYLKKQGLPLTPPGTQLRRIYYPYWKTDAILLKVKEKPEQRTPSGGSALTADVSASDLFGFGSFLTAPLTQPKRDELISERGMNVSLTPYTSTMAAGPATEAIPHDMGLRAGYVRMAPFRNADISEEDEYIPVTIPWARVVSTIRQSLALHKMAYGGSDRILQKRLFRQSGAVIYFPYYTADIGSGPDLRQFIIDGKSGRVVGHTIGKDIKTSWRDNPVSVTEFGELTVAFHRCSTCGVDLQPTRSCVHICSNCQTVTSLDDDRGIRSGITVAGGGRSADTLFPFWMLGLPGELVQSIAKSSSDVSRPEALVIPAFRISNFGVMRKLCRRMTTAMTGMSLSPVETYDPRFRPVDVGVSEAIALAEICLYCEQVISRSEMTADEVEIDPSQTGLVFVPFRPEHYFYVDTVQNAVTFAKAALSV